MRAASIKFCSLREVNHAGWAIGAGADLFGLIFAAGRRRVTVERAREIVDAATQVIGGPKAVGVFVDQDIIEINTIAQSLGLAYVQLHGDETPADVSRVDRPAIKAIRPSPGETLDQIAARIDAFERASRPPIAFLIDGFHPRHPGGHGVLADWRVARHLAERFPVILAGGLTPENLEEAILTVQPYGVDVSSGVETNGAKDRVRMSAFASNGRAAFEKVSR